MNFGVSKQLRLYTYTKGQIISKENYLVPDSSKNEQYVCQIGPYLVATRAVLL